MSDKSNSKVVIESEDNRTEIMIVPEVNRHLPSSRKSASGRGDATKNQHQNSYVDEDLPESHARDSLFSEPAENISRLEKRSRSEASGATRDFRGEVATPDLRRQTNNEREVDEKQHLNRRGNKSATKIRTMEVIDLENGLDESEQSPLLPEHEVKVVTDNQSRMHDLENRENSPKGGGNALHENPSSPSYQAIKVNDVDVTDKSDTNAQNHNIDNKPDDIPKETLEDKTDFETIPDTNDLSKASVAEEEPETLRVLFDFPPRGRGKIQVTTEELRRLTEYEYLNDSLIDFYVKVIEHENRKKNPGMRNSNCKFFSSFFFGRLRPGPGQFDYDGVKRWTNRVNLFSTELVFVPICESAHWSLIIIANLNKLEKILMNDLELEQMDVQSRPKILYLDSLDPRRGTSFARSMMQYLAAEWITRKTKVELTRDTQKDIYDRIRSVIKVEKPHVPQQINEVDCGLYLLYNLSCFLEESNGMKNELLVHGAQSKSIKTWYTHMQIHCLREEMIKLITVMDNATRNGSNRSEAIPHFVQPELPDGVHQVVDVDVSVDRSYVEAGAADLNEQTILRSSLSSTVYQQRHVEEAFCLAAVENLRNEDNDAEIIDIHEQSIELQQTNYPIRGQIINNHTTLQFGRSAHTDVRPHGQSYRSGDSPFNQHHEGYFVDKRAPMQMPSSSKEKIPLSTDEPMDLTNDDEMDTGA